MENSFQKLKKRLDEHKEKDVKKYEEDWKERRLRSVDKRRLKDALEKVKSTEEYSILLKKELELAKKDPCKCFSSDVSNGTFTDSSNRRIIIY